MTINTYNLKRVCVIFVERPKMKPGMSRHPMFYIKSDDETTSDCQNIIIHTHCRYVNAE